MGQFSQSLNEALQQGAGALYSAEFDDALINAVHWKNPRYVVVIVVCGEETYLTV